MLAIRGAGFISAKLVNSYMALDFAYALYLRLTRDADVSVSEVKRIVQRWYVLSVLTGRYSSSPESAFYKDIRQINEIGAVEALKAIEAATLSDNFLECPRRTRSCLYFDHQSDLPCISCGTGRGERSFPFVQFDHGQRPYRSGGGRTPYFPQRVSESGGV